MVFELVTLFPKWMQSWVYLSIAKCDTESSHCLCHLDQIIQVPYTYHRITITGLDCRGLWKTTNTTIDRFIVIVTPTPTTTTTTTTITKCSIVPVYCQCTFRCPIRSRYDKIQSNQIIVTSHWISLRQSSNKPQYKSSPNETKTATTWYSITEQQYMHNIGIHYHKSNGVVQQQSTTCTHFNILPSVPVTQNYYCRWF